MSDKQRAGRVLLVDDEEAVRVTLQAILQKEGYDVHAVESGEAALDAIRGQQFDFVISDLRLGGQMDGLDVLRSAHERDPEVELMMITGYVSSESAIEALRLAAIAYMPKPCSIQELKDTVARGLARKRLRESVRQQAIDAAISQHVLQQVLDAIPLGVVVQAIDGRTVIRNAIGPGTAPPMITSDLRDARGAVVGTIEVYQRDVEAH